MMPEEAEGRRVEGKRYDVTLWNRLYAVGSGCVVMGEDGVEEKTVTRSIAYEDALGRAVVKVCGRVEAVELEGIVMVKERGGEGEGTMKRIKTPFEYLVEELAGNAVERGGVVVGVARVGAWRKGAYAGLWFGLGLALLVVWLCGAAGWMCVVGGVVNAGLVAVWRWFDRELMERELALERRLMDVDRRRLGALRAYACLPDNEDVDVEEAEGQ